ncbi:hypothetical protein D9758_010685 [Tetrapyrgos nigripes]|uniref:F-box domain-containing protein n=1 Tax=Tetrapyrgos nigripes TaxID=182062 RepID=A0A8H5LP54_9AGAR|nr:hypothetical protein D9758_010685 [Tetrapyrgos nigripes]
MRTCSLENMGAAKACVVLPDVRHFQGFDPTSRTAELIRLGSYSILSDIEFRQIFSSIELCDQQLSQYTQEIDQHCAALEALEKQRDSVLQTKAIRQALLAPICRLPVELLGEIFSWCSLFPVQDDAQLALSHSRGQKETFVISLPILNVSQTCTLWRNVALSRADLWTDITICFDSLYGYRPEAYGSDPAEVLGQYLSRSKDSPLAVTLHLFRPREEGFPAVISFDIISMSILDTLLEQSSGRWKSLVLALDASSAAAEHLDSEEPSHAFPMLSQLSVFLLVPLDTLDLVISSRMYLFNTSLSRHVLPTRRCGSVIFD